jgi:hypothetical protein
LPLLKMRRGFVKSLPWVTPARESDELSGGY